jgi:hypothetical protein
MGKHIFGALLLYPQANSPQYPSYRSPDRPRIQSGWITCPCWESNPQFLVHPVCYLVATSTELSQLHKIWEVDLKNYTVSQPVVQSVRWWAGQPVSQLVDKPFGHRYSLDMWAESNCGYFSMQIQHTNMNLVLSWSTAMCNFRAVTAACWTSTPETRYTDSDPSNWRSAATEITWCITSWNISQTVSVKSVIFWDMTLCSMLSCNRRFGGTYRLHLHGRRTNFSKNQQVSRWQAE